MRQIPPPFLLQQIPHPPASLYIRGKFPEGQYIFLTVVGSRDHTEYGAEVCRHLIHSLRGYPVVIVSGLARGVDTLAHESALEAGLITIALPGSGLHDEVIYPKRNRNLAQKILNAGGCLLSSFDPSFEVQKWCFEERNRIMVGLSHAVLVIESREHSGTSMTARFAAEYGREVMVVPGSIFGEHSFGNHRLLQDGATPVACKEDMLACLGLSDLQKNDFCVNNERNEVGYR